MSTKQTHLTLWCDMGFEDKQKWCRVVARDQYLTFTPDNKTRESIARRCEWRMSTARHIKLELPDGSEEWL